MPIYQYWDEERGVTVELRRAVEKRDAVPAGLRRITVPQRVALFGLSSDPKEPGAADEAVPKALKSLDNGTVNQMVKESGISVEKYRETWGL